MEKENAMSQGVRITEGSRPNTSGNKEGTIALSAEGKWGIRSLSKEASIRGKLFKKKTISHPGAGGKSGGGKEKGGTMCFLVERSRDYELKKKYGAQMAQPQKTRT